MIIEIQSPSKLKQIVKEVDESSDLASLSYENFKTVYDFINENDISLNVFYCDEQFRWVRLRNVIEELSESDLETLSEFLDDSQREDYNNDPREAIFDYCKKDGISELADMLSYKYDVVLLDNELGNERLFVYLG